MSFYSLYGLDWLLFVIILIYLRWLGQKKREAFIIGVLICINSIAIAILVDSIAGVVMNLIFAFMHMRNYVKWGNSKTF